MVPETRFQEIFYKSTFGYIWPVLWPFILCLNSHHQKCLYNHFTHKKLRKVTKLHCSRPETVMPGNLKTSTSPCSTFQFSAFLLNRAYAWRPNFFRCEPRLCMTLKLFSTQARAYAWHSNDSSSRTRENSRFNCFVKLSSNQWGATAWSIIFACRLPSFFPWEWGDSPIFEGWKPPKGGFRAPNARVLRKIGMFFLKLLENF